MALGPGYEKSTYEPDAVKLPGLELQGANQAIVRLLSQRNGAYEERDQLVAALSKVFFGHLVRDPAEQEGWQTVVCVHIPAPEGKTTQVTWHIPDIERPLFAHLTAFRPDCAWDGHSTEEKYRRLAQLEVRWLCYRPPCCGQTPAG